MNGHSMVLAGVTHALNAKALADVDGSSWHVVSYQESSTLGGTPEFTVVLPGRTALMTSGVRVPWREILCAGDLIQTCGWDVTGLHAHEEPVTMMDGLIKSVGTQESLTDGAFSYQTVLRCAGLQDVMMQDSVAWWMSFGSVEGWAKARAELLPDDLSGAVDKILANYMNKVVFSASGWERDGVGLGGRLGYHLRTLTPNAALETNLAVQEGTHWGLMSGLLDSPLHEMYTAVLPAGSPMSGGFAHKPTVKARALVGEIAADGGATHLIVRPAPYPWARPGGDVVMADWNALTLHDFSEDASQTFGERGHDYSDDAVKNFIMVFPAFQAATEEMMFTAGLGVQNRVSIKRYAPRPFRMRTHLTLPTGPKENLLDLAAQLTWRIAAQHNQLDVHMTSGLSIPFNPRVQPGHRVRLRDPAFDRTEGSLMQAHVRAVSRTWEPMGGGTTTLSLERMLPDAFYGKDKQWHAQDLSPVQVDAASTAPSSKPQVTE